MVFCIMKFKKNKNCAISEARLWLKSSRSTPKRPMWRHMLLSVFQQQQKIPLALSRHFQFSLIFFSHENISNSHASCLAILSWSTAARSNREFISRVQKVFLCKFFLHFKVCQIFLLLESFLLAIKFQQMRILVNRLRTLKARLTRVPIFHM